MGACLSDQSAGKEAAGGVEGDRPAGARAQNNAGVNEAAEAASAVAHMTNSKGLSSQIELSVSAVGLIDKDLLAKSDPMLVLYQRNASGSWEEMGRTEVILQTQDPKWVTQLFSLYNFEETQELWFRIFDMDMGHTKFSGNSRDVDLSQQHVLGEAECLMVEVLTARHQTLVLQLQPSKDGRSSTRSSNLGKLTVQAEEIENANALVTIKMRGVNVDKMDFLGKSDAFLRISRLRGDDESWVPVYKTEVVINSLNPSWQAIKITLQQLCNGDLERPLLIECLDFDLHGSHPLIGTARTSLKQLQDLSESGDKMDLKRPPKHKDPSKPGGQILVSSTVITPRHSFLDYVFGGCEISFMVAVDFTASNGDPRIPGTLHHIDESGSPNAYQQAMQGMGEVIQFYDTDKLFPAWGFGGKPHDAPVSHCFALNGDEARPAVIGVQGILAAYAKALGHTTLAGPTLFAPVIQTASGVASQFISQEKQKYFCLLIITDGVITDLDNTIAALVDASTLPLSIFIFGVGNADFTRMEVLDANKHRLVTADGRVADRDNVGFFPMRDYNSTSQLARKMLAELPGQMLLFFQARNITPNKPIRTDSVSENDGGGPPGGPGWEAAAQQPEPEPEPQEDLVSMEDHEP